MTQGNTHTSISYSLRLRQAILANDIPLVERLLNANPHILHNPDFQDKANTSLHLAANSGHAELVEFLISKGHDSTSEVTDLIYSSSGNNLGISVNTLGQTSLHLASAQHHIEVIEVLCIEFPGTVNRGDKDGCTPLLLAAGRQPQTTTKVIGGRKNTLQSTEDIRALETLLRHGADVRAQDHEGNTCLHQACAWGNLKSARVLVEAGADPSLPNFKGFPPDSFSLTVQADVYFRNLVAEVEKRRIEDQARKRERRVGGGGHVRLVQDDQVYESPDENEYSRDRADSGRSYATADSTLDSTSGLGISSDGRASTR